MAIISATLPRRPWIPAAVRHVQDIAVDLVEEPTKIARAAGFSGARLTSIAWCSPPGTTPNRRSAAFRPSSHGRRARSTGSDIDAPLLIVGSGLTMVDMALSLDRRGHRGPIVVVSRRGLLPHAHRPAHAPLRRGTAKSRSAPSVSKLLRWLRALAAEGADWRSAVDALRPHTQRLWRSMTNQKRAASFATPASSRTSIAIAWRPKSRRRSRARRFRPARAHRRPGPRARRGGEGGRGRKSAAAAPRRRSRDASPASSTARVFPTP